MHKNRALPQLSGRAHLFYYLVMTLCKSVKREDLPIC